VFEYGSGGFDTMLPPRASANPEPDSDDDSSSSSSQDQDVEKSGGSPSKNGSTNGRNSSLDKIGETEEVRKTPSGGATFYAKHDHFTKTGSGQTQEMFQE
jgi:rare lipoprotein A (peptidoglycan hydrolase)